MDKKTKDINDRIKRHNLGKNLYHYTSIDTLIGILANKELWMSNVLNMNDMSEVTDYISRVKEALPEKAMNDRVRNVFDNVEKKMAVEAPYAICFSKLEDNAAQWERYGDNAEGICIEFNTFNLISAFYSYKILINEIYYDYDIEKHELYKMILDNYDSENFDAELIQSQLIPVGGVHKHKSFSTEEEIRIMTLFKNIPDCSDIQNKKIGKSIRRYVVINFAELCEKNNLCIEDTIDKVLIGPRSEQNIYELKQYVGKLGYKRLSSKIYESECPLR